MRIAEKIDIDCPANADNDSEINPMTNQLNDLEKRLQNLEFEAAQIKSEINELRESEFKRNPSAGNTKPVQTAPQTKTRAQTKPKGKIDIFFDNLTAKARQDFEVFLGGNLFAKLGAFAMILAAAWLVNYAIDREWLNESTRIWFLLTLGSGLTLYGLHLSRRTLQFLPGIVTGTGAAINFISLYAAYSYYDLFSVTEAFLYMTLQAVLVLGIAHLLNKQILYIIAFAGAVLLPALLSTGENSFRFLFAYLVFLNAMHFLLSLKKNWRMASYLVLFSSLVVFTGWSDALPRSNFIVPYTAMSIIFLAFFVKDIIQVKNDYTISHSILCALNVLAYIFVFGILFRSYYADYKPLQHIVTAMVLIAGIHQNSQIGITAKKIRVYAYGVIAVLLMYTGIYELTAGNVSDLNALVFAGVTALFAWHFRRPEFIITSLVLLVISALNILFSAEPDPGFVILNPRFGMSIILVAFLLAALKYSEKLQIPLFPFTRNTYAVFALVMIIFAAFAENYDFVSDPHHRNLGYSYILAFFGALVITGGVKLKNPAIRYTGLGLLGLMILKLYLYDIWSLSKGIRIVAGFSLGAALLITGIWYEKYRNKTKKE